MTRSILKKKKTMHREKRVVSHHTLCNTKKTRGVCRRDPKKKSLYRG